jgi:hypothetical protein
MNEENGLYRGIFWVISDTIRTVEMVDKNDYTGGIFIPTYEFIEISDHKLLSFRIRCNQNGEIIKAPSIEPNSNKGNNYKHRKTWDLYVKGDPLHYPYNINDFDYYPRGRVSISNECAEIRVNPIINQSYIISDIRNAFGLNRDNILKYKVIEDNSVENWCFIDKEKSEYINRNYYRSILRSSSICRYAVLLSNDLHELKAQLTLYGWGGHELNGLIVEIGVDGFTNLKEDVSAIVAKEREWAIRKMVIKSVADEEEISRLRDMSLVEYYELIL